jgi:hypothetical protein
LDASRAHREVGRDFSSRDTVPKTTFQERGTTGNRVLKESPNFGIIYKGRDANHKAAPSGPFFGRTFDGML